TGTETIIHGGANTTSVGATVTTAAGGEGIGAAISGNGSGTFTWNINGNISGTDIHGFSDTASNGTIAINNNATIHGSDNLGPTNYDGIHISTVVATTNILNHGTITSGTGGNAITSSGSSHVGTINNYGTISSGTGGIGIQAVNGEGLIGIIN